MAKFFTLNLVKKNGKGRPAVQISAEEYIARRGEKVQMIGMFETLEDAELARDTKGNKKLLAYWGRNVNLEVRGGRVGFSNVSRRREFFAIFVR